MPEVSVNLFRDLERRYTATAAALQVRCEAAHGLTGPALARCEAEIASLELSLGRRAAFDETRRPYTVEPFAFVTEGGCP